MSGPETVVPVELEADGQSVNIALGNVSKHISDIKTQIAAANKLSKTGATDFDAAMEKTLRKLKTSLSQLATIQQGLATVGQGVGGANAAQSLGNATDKAVRFTRAMKDAGNATEVIQTRLASINKLQAANGGKDDALSRKYIRMKDAVLQAESEIKKLDRAIQRSDDLARQKGATPGPERARAISARDAIVSKVSNGNSVNFGTEMAAGRDAAAAYLNTSRAILTTVQQTKKTVRDTNTARIEANRLKSEETRKANLGLKVAKDQLRTTITDANALNQKELGEERLYDLRRRSKTAADAEQNAILRSIQLEKERVRIAEALLRVQKQSEVKPLSRSEILNTRKAQIPGSFGALNDKAIEDAIASSMERQERIQKSLNGLSAQANRDARDELSYERATTAELRKQQTDRAKSASAADRVRRAEAKANAPIVAQPDKPSAVQNIMSPSYMLAAAARTSVYGAAAAAVYTFTAAVRNGIVFLLDFEKALADLQAIAGATDEQMKGVQDNILKIGTNSKFSVIELTSAATTLAQAGFSVKDLESSLGAVSQLATASGSSMAESVDLITAAIGSFQLQASEAGRVGDILVAALNRSRLGVEQVAKAIQYVGATAFEQNISLEELVASAGALANAGIKSGSTIGTGMRQFLVDLKDPTEKLKTELSRLGLTLQDVDVKTKGYANVLQTMKDAGFGAAQAYAGLETRAAASYLVLKNNLDVMQDLLIAEAQQGQAIVAQERAMNSLTAQWQRFKNVIAMDSGELSDDWTTSLRHINDFIERVPLAQKAYVEWLKSINKTSTSLKEQARAAYEAGDSFTGLSLEVQSAGIELFSFITYSGDVTQSQKNIETAVNEAGDAVHEQTQKLDTIDQAITRLIVTQKSYVGESEATRIATMSLANQFEDLSVFLAQNTRDIFGVIDALNQYRVAANKTMGEALVNSAVALQSQQDAAVNGARGSARRLKNQGLSADQDKALKLALGSSVPSQAVFDLTKSKLFKGRPEKVMELQNLASNLASGGQAESGLRVVEHRMTKNKFERTPTGQRVVENTRRIGAEAELSRSEILGADLATRKSISAKKVSGYDKNLAGFDKDLASDKLNEGARAVLQEKRDEIASLRQEALGWAIPTKAESKPDRKKDAAARRDAKRQERNALDVAKTTFKTSELDLKATLKNYKDPASVEVFTEGAEAIETALENWVTDKTALLELEIDKKDMNSDDAANYMREGREQIALKVEEVHQAITEGLISTLEGLTLEADRAFERRNFEISRRGTLLDAQRQGLDSESNRDRIPDFVRINLDKKIGLEAENNDRAKVESNLILMSDYANAILKVESTIKMLEQKAGLLEGEAGFDTILKAGSSTADLADKITVLGNKTGKISEKEMAALRQVLEDIVVKMKEMGLETDGLMAKLGAASLAPKTFGEAIQGAATAYASVNGLNNSFSENLHNNLMPAIGEAHGAFTTFFQDMITKPQEVLANFANFARSILSMVQKLAAQLIAQQIFGVLLNLAGSFAGSSMSLAGTGAASASGGGAGSASAAGGHGDFRFGGSPKIGGFFNGGPIVGYAGGGKVNHGVPNRDSVLTALARGEYVVRKSAVDSVGEEFLNDVNQKGARALRNMGPVAMPASSGPEQKMNVYVVAPEEQPAMGPNDVIAILSRDILKDGNTKRLIKHVAQGG